MEIKISSVWNFPHSPFISSSLLWHYHHHHIRRWHKWVKLFDTCFLHYWALKLNAEFDSLVHFFLLLPFFQGSRVCPPSCQFLWSDRNKKLSSNLQVVSCIGTQWQCLDTEFTFLCFCFQYTSWHSLFWKVLVKNSLHNCHSRGRKCYRNCYSGTQPRGPFIMQSYPFSHQANKKIYFHSYFLVEQLSF